MLFADFTHPSTIVALLVGAALAGLAFAAAFRGIATRPVRWLARGLAAVALALGLLGAVGMGFELWSSDLPLVLPDAPLGTYAQMTQLGLLVGITTFGLTTLGAALAYRWPGLGGRLLVAVGLLDLVEAARTWLQDPTLPQGSLAVGVVLAILVLVTGTLVLAARRSERRPPPVARTRARFWQRPVHRGPELRPGSG